MHAFLKGEGGRKMIKARLENPNSISVESTGNILFYAENARLLLLLLLMN